MEFIFNRKINYYETDRMGVVHHSNYIRFLEEARCAMLDAYGMPYSSFEEHGIMIPVLGVSCQYKQHVTFDDVIEIKIFIKSYNGVRLNVQYEITNKKTNAIIFLGETKHCFTDMNIKPINLKKYLPEFSQKFENGIKNN